MFFSYCKPLWFLFPKTLFFLYIVLLICSSELQIHPPGSFVPSYNFFFFYSLKLHCCNTFKIKIKFFLFTIFLYDSQIKQVVKYKHTGTDPNSYNDYPFWVVSLLWLYTVFLKEFIVAVINIYASYAWMSREE